MAEVGKKHDLIRCTSITLCGVLSPWPTRRVLSQTLSPVGRLFVLWTQGDLTRKFEASRIRVDVSTGSVQEMVANN